MRKPRMLSLCSGIGGLDIAWEWAGGEVAGQCEIDPFCTAVLANHWPDVMRVADIRDVDGASYGGPIDLIAGGIPCQPFSVAGKRGGAFDPRHLWPEMRRIIALYQPAFVCVENVVGFIGMALDDVLTDLGSAGYEAGAVVLPAAAVGAPHARARVFVVAHRNQHSGRWAQRAIAGDVGSATRADAARQGNTQRATAECGGTDVAHDDGQRPQRDIQLYRATQAGKQVSAGRQARGCDANGARQRQAQSHMGGGADGLPRWLDGDRWPAGPGEAQHEWEPPRVTRESIPNRAARLKALGNAVVPQQVYPVLAAIAAEWMKEN